MRPVRILIVLLAAGLAPACNCGKTAPKITQHPKDVGEACGADSECKSNLCAALPGGDGITRCQAPCPNCPSGDRCVQVGVNNGQARFACAPDPQRLCQSCSTDADCGYPGDACLQSGDVTACGEDCTGDGQCPSGYECASATLKSGGTAARQCVPTSGTCACTEASRGQTRPCQHSNTYGTCSGVEICDPAVGYTGCDALVPAPEVCDGVDNDCNGKVDDGLGTTTCGHGACQVTVDNCVNGQVQQCAPDMSKAVAETCNGLDDDCDGVVDNGFNLNSDVNNCGQCGRACPSQNGTPTCDNTFCTITCDPGFDDCNHNLVDGCETDLGSSVDNCGSCNNRCGFANGIAACEDGGCAMTGCQAGFYDLDQNPANGCEYACAYQSATDVPDITTFGDGGVGFTDANCDGLDGMVDGGVFVSATGNDSNPGTMALPFRTIQHGIDVAFTNGIPDVYVASGAYTGPITLKDGVGVYGGYLPSGGRWDRSLSAAVTITGGNPVIVGNNVHDVTVQLLNVVGSQPSAPGSSSIAVQLVDSVNVTFDHVNVAGNDGANGSDGTDGVAGAPGNPGLDGEPGYEDSSWPCSSGSGIAPAGGAPGKNSACTAANGGRGGIAGHSSNWGTDGGRSAGGANGGDGRQDGKGDSVAPSINDGQDGWTPATTDGAPAANLGSFGATLYTPANGTDGLDGPDGVGGGGGGGGGGGTVNCDSWGSGGGGGGSGGCGGTKGTHGQGGGASIAVWLNNTNLTALACSFIAGNGGNGGMGGKGGAGGAGKAGGKSPYSKAGQYPPGSNDSNQDDGSVGGVGGKGGDGARGGNAGGGGGGPSIAVFTELAATYSPDGATVTQAGAAGRGGYNAATGASFRGADGIAQAVYP